MSSLGIMETSTYRLDGHLMYEYSMQVPVDYFGAMKRLPAGVTPQHFSATIDLFAREYVRNGHENDPRLVFFQGGPGSAGPRMAPLGSWLDTALDHFRVVLIDERGTGNSQPLEAIAVTSLGSADVQAAYLSCFRQDSIVRDAEALRQELQGDTPWAALGQSFGGFTVTSYLSQMPEGLSEAFITAGLPSLHLPADDVYSRTYRSTAVRNREFFDRYPQDEEMAWFISTHLADVEEIMPNGERLTPGRFRQLGIVLGYSYGPDLLHFLLENPVWQQGGQRRLRPQFLARVCNQLSFAEVPLYGIIHEAIYGQRSTGSTAWAAQRVRSAFPEFALPQLAAGGSGELDLRRNQKNFYFTGETIYPWQVASDPALAPMAEAAEKLAFQTDWPELYSQFSLAENTVPTAAWIYVDDMFVPYELSVASAKSIRGLKPLISNAYHHDGLRTGGPQMIEKLLKAVRN